jgi:hypothetical protein
MRWPIPFTHSSGWDDYESIVPNKEADNEYIRVERPVQLASGQEILAWVYLYQKERDRAGTGG